MDRIDFRSDTVTWPTPEMRDAMARADVGDDVYGEDRTVVALEERAAELLGFDAGLYVASGTMGNLAAILAHAQRGDEAILGYDSHIFQWEAGGMASLAGVMPHVLPTDEDGQMDLDRIETAIREDDPHLPISRLILLENSFGGRGGVPLPVEYFSQIREIADRHGLSMHLDGARIFNASAALKIDAATLVRDLNSVTFCLSKGLCAPVGSVLCGSTEFIHRARRARKSLGGGMRQAGILAAAGLLSLNTMVDRLSDDNALAETLAEGLAEIPGIRVNPEPIRTNIVHFKLEASVSLGPQELVDQLDRQHGIGLGTYPVDLLRAVTHYWLGSREVEMLLSGIRSVLA